jgi:hypothetical protein
MFSVNLTSDIILSIDTLSVLVLSLIIMRVVILSDFVLRGSCCMQSNAESHCSVCFNVILLYDVCRTIRVCVIMRDILMVSGIRACVIVLIVMAPILVICANFLSHF